MSPRVYGVIKDVVVIAFFFVTFYALTHNPVVRPEPSLSRDIWSIELHQQPLALGIAGHNYLVLRDDTGVIVSTLHGLPTDVETDVWKYIGRTKKDVLKVWEFEKEDEKDMRNGSYGISLLKTNKEEALLRWSQARSCADIINGMTLPYPPFGIALRKDTENSNSVAYTLASCMNLKTSHIGIFTPGWGKNLLE